MKNKKIRIAIEGRKNLFFNLKRQCEQLKPSTRIWIHSASLGEFEQAKPIVSALKKKYTDCSIIVTFFSPSGYMPSKNYNQADIITYIPFDSRKNSRQFLDILKPDIAIMIRYDLWPNHIWELEKRNVPIILASASLGKHTNRKSFFRKSFLKQVFSSLTAILTISDEQYNAYKSLALNRTIIETIGETRYDQVWQRSITAKAKHILPRKVFENKIVFVFGSSWIEDEDVVLPAFERLCKEFPNLLMILVPHEPTLEVLSRLEAHLSQQRIIRFSDLNDYNDENIIIVDSIGILMTLYQYASVAYVGGSFKQGIHNVLEPAAYGIPIIYGPKHKNSSEAIELASRGGSYVITNTEECYSMLRNFFTNSQHQKQVGTIAFELVRKNIGATERCVEFISKYMKEK